MDRTICVSATFGAAVLLRSQNHSLLKAKMDGTQDYKLTTIPPSFTSEVEVASSMSASTARGMVQLVRTVPRGSVDWTTKMANEVACWANKANHDDNGDDEDDNNDHQNNTVRPPRAARQVLGDSAVLRESTIIRGLTPMFDNPDHFRRYVAIFKRRVPNWEEYLEPLFGAFLEMQGRLSRERSERRRFLAASEYEEESEDEADTQTEEGSDSDEESTESQEGDVEDDGDGSDEDGSDEDGTSEADHITDTHTGSRRRARASEGDDERHSSGRRRVRVSPDTEDHYEGFD